jgi:hypothetical protein
MKRGRKNPSPVVTGALIAGGGLVLYLLLRKRAAAPGAAPSVVTQITAALGLKQPAYPRFYGKDKPLFQIINGVCRNVFTGGAASLENCKGVQALSVTPPPTYAFVWKKDPSGGLTCHDAKSGAMVKQDLCSNTPKTGLSNYFTVRE